jgi:hypothetical protein
VVFAVVALGGAGWWCSFRVVVVSGGWWFVSFLWCQVVVGVYAGAGMVAPVVS